MVVVVLASSPGLTSCVCDSVIPLILVTAENQAVKFSIQVQLNTTKSFYWLDFRVSLCSQVMAQFAHLDGCDPESSEE